MYLKVVPWIAIEHLSLAAAKKEIIQIPWAWITISSDKRSKKSMDEFALRLGPYLKGYLNLRFDDIDETTYNRMEPKEQAKIILFSNEHAKQIIEFVDKMKDQIVYFVINCEAGISRSGAVGTWLCDYWGLNYEQFRLNHRHIMPNGYVLRVLRRVSDMLPQGAESAPG